MNIFSPKIHVLRTCQKLFVFSKTQSRLLQFGQMLAFAYPEIWGLILSFELKKNNWYHSKVETATDSIERPLFHPKVQSVAFESVERSLWLTWIYKL